MKKQGIKKPRAVPAGTTGTKAAVKKKRLKSITPENKLRALLVATVLVLVAALSSLVIMHVQSVETRLPDTETAAYVIHPAEAAAIPVAPTTPIAPAAEPPVVVPPGPEPGSRGALVFVIDDAGHNLRDLEPFLNFPGPITIAVLPGLPYSAEAARRVRASGRELLLHQPMESIGGTDPGPGAIMAGMGSDEIRAIISRNLDELGPVAGMNNHEGSRITMDAEAMETILDISRERGIFFLDS